MSGAEGSPRPRSIGVRDFVARKARGEKLVVISTYDALFGRLADESGVDAVLVGDSLGTVIAGLDSTIPVTLDQMIYHARITRRGVTRALLVVDMPFLSYQVSPEIAMANCGRMVQESEAEAVKLEGGSDQIARVVRAVTGIGIPVMGHLGYTPQSEHALGRHRVQARERDAAQRMVDDAKRLEDAGAFSIVLELIPAAVAAEVTAAVSIPTIGIGAGVACDGQVLVLHDLLGLTDRFTPKFLKRYASQADDVRRAVRQFGEDVREERYPDDDHSF